MSGKRPAEILVVNHNLPMWSQIATTSGPGVFMWSQTVTTSGPTAFLRSQFVTSSSASHVGQHFATVSSACHGGRRLRPFTGVSGAAGIRPGIYAGLVGHAQHGPPRPIHGPSRLMGASARTAGPSRRPVNGPDNRQSFVGPRSPVLKDGPNTACGGKGRKRPWIYNALRPELATPRPRIGFHAKPEGQR